jgi:transcriptional regulator with XRE-family HTH domain
MKKRIERILVKYQITSAQFADIVGVQRSSISHILSGRNKPSFDFIQKILVKYPEINAKWLITGEGDIDSDEIKPLLNSDSSIQGLFNTNVKVQDNTVNEPPVTPPVTDVKRSVPQTEKTQFKQRVTNVNSIKRIIIIYSDNSFEVLTGR